MNGKKNLYFTSILILLGYLNNFALAHSMPFPFYVGGSAGYGSTNWSGLVDTSNGPNEDGTSAYLPQSAKDSGIDFGFFIGYDIGENFAIELRYLRLATTQLTFTQSGNVYLGYPFTMPTSTYVYSLIGKFIVPISQSHFAPFAFLGAAYSHRSDILAHPDPDINQNQYGQPGSIGRFGATFGGGLNWQATDRILMALQGTYVTGYGRSVAEPVAPYIPFVYSVDLNIAYRFAL